MPHYRIYYVRQLPEPSTPPATRATLAETHVLVHELDADNLNQVYARMQADAWPSTKAMLAFDEHVHALGSFHTSMSAGDVAYDCATDTYYQCTFFSGWREVE